MLQLILLGIGASGMATVLKLIYNFGGVDYPGFLCMSVVFLLVLLIWTGTILACINETIQNQTRDLHSLKQLKADKASYKAQKDEYIADVGPELLEKYKEFEKALMVSVKDSKIVATIFQQSGYAELLREYNKTVTESIRYANDCDRKYEGKIVDMFVR